MNKQIKSRGFTIVELLIVIVVIAILAAITIVAYNGIQNRANTTAAQAAASTVAKKAEAFHTSSDVGVYPADKAAFATVNESVLDASIAPNVQDATLPTSTSPKVISYKSCDSGRGAQIVYWSSTENKAIQIGVGSTPSSTSSISLCS